MKKIVMKTFQRKNGYPPSYYATEKDLANLRYRVAQPSVIKNEHGSFKNGRITSVRYYES
jgi:hypothetical protein